MKNKVSSILLMLVLAAVPALAQTLTQQASAQFRTAEKADAALNDKPEQQRSRADYLRVIRSYERVYLITPHTAWADNALMSIARLYELMKDNKNAVKTLQFLLNDYPQTPFKEVVEQDIARLTLPPSPTSNEVASKESASIQNVRYWIEPRSLRVEVDVEGSVSFKVGDVKSPDRFFVDVSPARIHSMLKDREWTVQTSKVQKIRVAQFDLSTVRIVLDGVTAKGAVTTNLKDPNRIVIEVPVEATTPLANPKPITSVTPPAVSASAPSPATTPPANPKTVTSVTPPVVPASAPPPVVTPQPTTAVAQQVTESSQSATPVAASNPKTNTQQPPGVVTAAKPTSLGDRSLIRSLGLKLSRVVIDAGHGGHDTGSIGPTGLAEKDLVLDVAKRLQALIQSQLGAEVVMTRESDTFVPLESRTQLANDEKADLFLSIHANSSPEKTVRGVETFFLNLNTQSRDALSTATRENAASEKKIHELQDILQKIVLNDKADESRELAKHVQQAMSKRGNAGSNRGVKQAPFVVLIGATMPSVLAEVSFISNPDEEKRLKAADYRQQIAESLFQGIKSYAETLSGTRAAN
jgi:N-acetylmuramoyl-L-alanine amidase